VKDVPGFAHNDGRTGVKVYAWKGERLLGGWDGCRGLLGEGYER